MPATRAFVPAALLLAAACAPTPAAVPTAADVAAAESAIDSLLAIAMEGSRTVNADQVTSIAEGAPDFSFVTGDIIVSGLDATRESFRRTYATIKGQSQEVLEKKFRLVTPDVAVLMTASEGTYTDTAGVVSEPVGMGLTIVFVRKNGRWVAEHAHQSIIR